MTASQSTYTKGQRIGLIVFVVAIAMTAGLIALGVAGIPWPRWFVALATVF